MGAKKHIKKKTHKEKNSRDCPGISGGNFVYVFFSPKRKDPPKKHINIILASTQSQDNPAFLHMFMCFFLSLTLGLRLAVNK